MTTETQFAVTKTANIFNLTNPIRRETTLVKKTLHAIRLIILYIVKWLKISAYLVVITILMYFYKGEKHE
jgi:hypothetical protein